MSCYYHPAVPTAMVCRDCGREICSHCAVDALCPGCRLGRAIDAHAADRPRLAGAVNGGPRAAAPDSGSQPGPARPAPTVSAIEPPPTTEDRLLAALCYPLWPIALLMLFIRSHRSAFVRYHVVQALGVNALGVLVYLAYSYSVNLPVVGWQSALFMPFMVPAWFFVDLYLAVRTYGGHTPRVPIAADYAEKYAA